MSNRKEDYLGSRIGQGQSIKHVTIADSQVSHDNSQGIVMDIHAIPEKEPDWDALRNHDLVVLVNRLIALEEKVGLYGWDEAGQEYTLVPKSNTVPSFATQSATDRYLDVGKGGATTRHRIGNQLHFLQKGNTHDEALALMDRAVYELSVRLGGGIPTPAAPGSSGNIFAGTYKLGDMVDGITSGSQLGPLPLYYKVTDTPTEAMAKLDYYISQLQKEWVPSHQTNQWDDPVNWFNGYVHNDKFWSSEFSQAQIQRLIEDIGMTGSASNNNPSSATFDYSTFTDAEKFIDPTQQKTYKVWSAARSAFAINSLWKRTTESLKRIIEMLSKLVDAEENVFGDQTKKIYSSNFDLGLNAETNGAKVTVDLFAAINPKITVAEQNKQVIILDVARRDVKGGYWARFVWALAGKKITEAINKNLVKIGSVAAEHAGIWWPNSQASVWDGRAKPGGGTYDNVAAMNWTQFQNAYMTSGTADTDDQFLPSNWDNTKLREMGSVYVASGASDEKYWSKDDGNGTWASGTYGTWNGRSWVANGFGPSTNGGTSATVSAVGGTTPITKEQLKYLPSVNTGIAGAFTWTAATSTWVHRSQRGSNGGNDKTGNTYIPSGKMEYSVDTAISGYSKPFILTDTPFQVLFAIDTSVGEDLSGFKYTKQQLEDYILYGTSLPTLTPPISFINKFSGDVQQLINSNP